MAQITLAEVIALYAAFGAEEIAVGPVSLLEQLLGDTDVNVWLTFRAVCNDNYEALQEVMTLCLQ